MNIRFVSHGALDLRDLTDSEREDSIAIAIAAIAGYTKVMLEGNGQCGNEFRVMGDCFGVRSEVPSYATSVDALKAPLDPFSIMLERVCYESSWEVRLQDGSKEEDDEADMVHRAVGPTQALAYCYALLAAHGVEVIL